MKRILMLLTIMVALTLSAHAQALGITLYSNNFDTMSTIPLNLMTVQSAWNCNGGAPGSDPNADCIPANPTGTCCNNITTAPGYGEPFIVKIDGPFGGVFFPSRCRRRATCGTYLSGNPNYTWTIPNWTGIIVMAHNKLLKTFNGSTLSVGQIDSLFESNTPGLRDGVWGGRTLPPGTYIAGPPGQTTGSQAFFDGTCFPADRSHCTNNATSFPGCGSSGNNYATCVGNRWFWISSIAIINRVASTILPKIYFYLCTENPDVNQKITCNSTPLYVFWGDAISDTTFYNNFLNSIFGDHVYPTDDGAWPDTYHEVLDYDETIAWNGDPGNPIVGPTYVVWQ